MEQEEFVALFFNVDSDSDDSQFGELMHSSTSESSSSDEEADQRIIHHLMHHRGPMNPRPRIRLYVDSVVSKYSREEFKSHFRLYPETFECVLKMIGPSIGKTRNSVGRRPIEPRKQLLFTLWCMATPDSYRSTCEKFDIGKATAIRTVRRVTYALYCLAPRVIVWPKDDVQSVKNTFERSSGFPDIIGAIDGVHVNIEAPKEDPKSYVDRKKNHSIQMQAVCTQNLLFTSVLAGNVGSVHDARVFRLSPVSEHLNDPDTYFPGDGHLVGDAAYGVHMHLMVPFKNNGHLSLRQRNYNLCLSSARVAIERAFGMWKARWRSIRDKFPMVTTEKIPEYLVATCVLHNICVLNNDFVPFEPLVNTNQHRGRLIITGRDQGCAKRNRIMNALPMRLNL